MGSRVNAQQGQWLGRIFRIWGLGKRNKRTASSQAHSQFTHLKEDDKGQSDGQNEPVLLREVVVTVISVVPVPGVGKYLKLGIRSLEAIYRG